MGAFHAFGRNAGAHHLVNVALHLASVLLLFFFLRRMTGALWRSALVAALFAIHPLRAESVAWISERKDVLSGLFFMLSLLAYLRYLDRPRSLFRYAVLLVLFAAGLMCKPMLVTFPFVLLLLDYWPMNRIFARDPGDSHRIRLNGKAILEKLPLFVLSAAACVVAFTAPAEEHGLESVPLATRLAEAPVAMLFYLGKMFWPSNLVFIYPRSAEVAGWWPIAAALLIALTAGFYLLRQKHPYLLVGWLWNLGMLVPVSGIVQISRHWIADHYTYLPQIGLSIMIAWGAGDWAGSIRFRRIAAGAMAAASLCALAFAAHRQTATWRDNLSLWTHAVARTHGDFLHRANMPDIVLEQMAREEAIIRLRASMRTKVPDAKDHAELGALLMRQCHVEAAAAEFRAALLLDPNMVAAHNNLGILLVELGRTNEAVAHFQDASRLDARDALARFNLGKVLRKIGRQDDAAAAFRSALDLSPDDADTLMNLGEVLREQGSPEEAVRLVRRAVESQPDHLAPKLSLAWMLATVPQESLRSGLEAVRLAGEVNRATGGTNPEALRVLAAAQAEAGDFSQASATAHRALAEAQGETAAQIKRDISAYGAGQPIRGK
jgi:Flp pilus assembly protein TadD